MTVSKTGAKQTRQRFSARFITFIGTDRFFWLTVLLFIAQGLWIALSARYPQAFDEQFHFGIIQIYSHHLSPFLSQQPAGADSFGALTRDPSYLYQYLLSFPYRLVHHFTNDVTIQVIVLRLINLAFLASSLPVFRRVLRYTKASERLINVTLLFLVLTPVFPLLGSQINYDNLVIPLSGVAVWMTLRFTSLLREQKTWSWELVAQLGVLCMLGSLVKYAFLPIMLAAVIAIIYAWIKSGRKLPAAARNPFAQLSNLKLVLYVLLVLGSGVLFWQRYGINVVRYHTPTPECNQVLSIKECMANAPWARNYQLVGYHIHLKPIQVATYPFVWVYRSMGELIFTISSNFNDTGTVDYHVGDQLILIEIIAWSIFGAGLLLCLVYVKRLWRNHAVRLMVLFIALYVAALGGQNLEDYLHIGALIGIHGRYLLPILPLAYILIALAFREAFNSLPAKKAIILRSKLTLATVMTGLLLFEGGGFVTYIIRSDPTWFWPQSSPVQRVNSKVKKILKPIVVDTNRS